MMNSRHHQYPPPWPSKSGPRKLPLVLAVSMFMGCEPPTTLEPPRKRRPLDKAALFGDPSLVPTRAAERARVELGLAHQILAAIEVLPSVDDARVDVELPGDPEVPRVLVVVQSPLSAVDLSALRDPIARIARTVVGPQLELEVILASSPSNPTKPHPHPSRWPLGLALVGLGFCAGIVVERGRRYYLSRRTAAHER